ncbi:putativegpd family base excision dna repair protein [Diaporthe ampelina]|uniref:Putativegpd family base excision dna repair protein n=1 Tax=Diaporthe ampelina TaxID=1214573 RepID=A0A0G2HVD6_9PEZI|nr:putativegpd family base excision dna repair protein [Diaporthe ampelina]
MKTSVKFRTPYEKKVLVPYKTTPYPKFQGPSAEDCEKVHSLLVKEHGPCLQPVEIPPPSLKIAGCGQVRQVCDALLRTVLSTNTQFDNADKAVQGLHQAIGTVTENLQLDPQEYTGLQDCLDYSRLRSLSLEAVQQAIQKGGNHIEKGINIKATVDQIYNINAERANSFREETAENPATVLAAEMLSEQQKQEEIWMFDKGILHLEYLRALSEKDAMNELMAFRGVGVKVAACILLFCMQKPVFAIDTHCFRMAKWLGWVPRGLKKGSEDEAFAHLDATVPDHLKYDLHQQFIRHGQFCLKCKTNSNEGWADWDKTVCPLEDLLQRTGKERPPPKPKAKKSVEETDLEPDEELENEEEILEPMHPKKRGRPQSDEDSDFEVPAQRIHTGKKGNAELKPAQRTTRSTRNSKKAFIEEAPEAVIKDETEHELAEIDVAEAMLNPVMHQEMKTKTKAEPDSSDLSEHSDSEFTEFNQ